MEEIKETSTEAGTPVNTGGQAQVIQLKNKDTAALYDCTYTTDCIVHVPGLYRGLVSNVPPNVADVLIHQGHRAFVKKAAAAAN